MQEILDGVGLHQLFTAGHRNLKKNMTAINDLNVFPVPDGDTGTIPAYPRGGGGSPSRFGNPKRTIRTVEDAGPYNTDKILAHLQPYTAAQSFVVGEGVPPPGRENQNRTSREAKRLPYEDNINPPIFP